jgi:hypothetical protein
MDAGFLSIAMSFESNKASGYDNIPMAVVQHSIGIISRPLAHIINLSISHGIVPDEMKIARLIPLFKAGDQAVLQIIDLFLFFRVSPSF